MPRDGHKTKQRILDAAQACVMERGFAATSVDDIQEAAGISRGTFFYHYPTKDALARALIQRYADEDRALEDRLMARAEQLATDPLQQTLIFLALHEDLFQEGGPAEAGCLFASYSYEAGVFDAGTRAVIRSSIEHWRGLLGGKLSAALERHPALVPDTDPYVLADVAYAQLQGAYVLWRELGDPALMVRHVRQLRSYVQLLFGVAESGAAR